MSRRLLALLGFLFAVIPLTFALTFPTLSGRVVDEANILDESQRTALTQKLADLETKSTIQLVVVTLKSLQGTSIEDYGYQLGRNWQIGQKGTNNGVLLIVAPNERKVRIEVGYGLEGTLTDAISRLIIENSILPRFRANDFPGGISRGVDDIIQVLSGDAEEWRQRATKRPDATPNWTTIVMFILAIVIVVIAFRVVAGANTALPGPVGGGRRRRDSTPWISTFPSGGGGWSSGSGGFDSGGGGFSGGGGSFGGGGASGSW